jgi:flagellar biosynthesis protein FlhF
MELKRVLGRDARSAAENAIAQYGKDVFVISTSKVGAQVELIVAMEGAPAPVQAVAPDVDAAARLPAGDAFGEVLSAARQASRSVALAPAAVSSLSLSLPLPPAPRAVARVAQVPDTATDVVKEIREELAGLRREFLLAQRAGAQGREQPRSETTQALREWHRQSTRSKRREQPRSETTQALARALDEASVSGDLRTLLLGAVAPDDSPVEGIRSMAAMLEASLRMTPASLPLQGLHAVCGASGAGKTLAAIRIARQAAEATPARIVVISLADHRPGAWARLQVLGASIGVETFRARDREGLRAILDELGDQAFVVIDTPVVDPVSLTDELGALGRTVEIHVVVPVDANQAVFNQLLRSGPGRWSSLILSKLDEATSPWPLIRTLCNHPVVVSGVGASDQAGDDLSPIDGQSLVDAAMRQILGQVRADMAEENRQNAPDTLDSRGSRLMSVPHGI